MVLSAYMAAFLLLYDWFTLSRADSAALLLASGLVLVAEAVNTALERTVDIASPQWQKQAGQAKDVAAAAVLIAAITAVLVGVNILWQKEAFTAMARYYVANPHMLAILALSLFVTGYFIWGVKAKDDDS
jgi:diacylglycerol kinase (ATP)